MEFEINEAFFEKCLTSDGIFLYGEFFEKTSYYVQEVDDYFRVGIKNYHIIYFENEEYGEIKVTLTNKISGGLSLNPEYEIKIPYLFEIEYPHSTFRDICENTVFKIN